MSRRKCRYLTGKQPRLFDVDLACIIGVNEAIFVNQLDYWLTLNEEVGRNIKDGHCWAYNSYRGWQLQFPFWPIKTIERIVLSLEKKNILITGNFNKLKMDRTKWYRINYEVVDSLELPPDSFSELISGNGHDKLSESIASNCRNAEPSTSQPDRDLNIDPEMIQHLSRLVAFHNEAKRLAKDEQKEQQEVKCLS